MIERFWLFLMKLAKAVFAFFFRIFGKQLSDTAWEKIEQFIRFCFVGLTSAVVLLAVYYCIIFIFGKKYYLPAQAVGYAASILNAFALNSRFVFSAQSNKNIALFVKMCSCYVLTFFIQMGLVYTQVEILHFSETVAPIIAILITTPINFLLNKLFAFRKKKNTKI